MLLEAMLRGTAVGLLTGAGQTLGANVCSSKDTPVPAGDKSWFVVYVDAEMEGEGGGAPTFRTRSIVTIEIRSAEADSFAAAQTLGDTLAEVVKRTLLTGQGFDVTLAMTNGGTHAVPAAGSPKLYPGFLVRGPGIDRGGDFIAVQTVNDDGSVELSGAYAGATGSYSFNIGSFIALFEQIDAVKRFPDYHGENRKHIFTDTIEVHGHVHEVFEPAVGPSLTGLNLYVDSVNIFDASSDFPGAEPFTGIAPAPRESGPDGRPEIAASIDLPQT